MVKYLLVLILIFSANLLHAELSMTLFDLEKKAYDNNLVLLEGKENLLSAKELYRASLAKWFPQVSADLTLAATHREVNATKAKHYLSNGLS